MALSAFHGLPHGTAVTQSPPPKRILVRSRGRVWFVPVNEIEWVQSAGNYLRLHAGDAVHVMRGTMKRLEAELDTREFLRIHRCTIVRIDRIRELKPWPTGEYVVRLRSGKELTLSRGYRGRIRALLEAAAGA